MSTFAVAIYLTCATCWAPAGPVFVKTLQARTSGECARAEARRLHVLGVNPDAFHVRCERLP